MINTRLRVQMQRAMEQAAIDMSCTSFTGSTALTQERLSKGMGLAKKMSRPNSEKKPENKDMAH